MSRHFFWDYLFAQNVSIYLVLKDMQTAFSETRNILWDRLKDVYIKYAQDRGEIPTERVEEIIRMS